MLTRAEQARQVLFEEIQPVKLSNCQLERFGEPNDGGYLLCAQSARRREVRILLRDFRVRPMGLRCVD